MTNSECTGRPSALSVLVALVGVLGMVVVAPDARAQSSANFKLSPGLLIGLAGNASSTNFKAWGESGALATFGRGSSDNNDQVAGLVGSTFTLVDTISITTTAGVYSSITFPIRISSSAVTSVLDELGAPNDVFWRFGHWSTADSAYADPQGTAPAPALTNVTPGLGYWLITQGAQTVRGAGLPAGLFAFRIPLALGPSGRPGWNQVGNPFLFPINVSALQVFDGTTTVGLTAGGNTFTEQVAKVQSGSSYVNATTINGRTAFWVRRLKPTGSVTLLVNPVVDPAGIPGPALAKPDGAAWAVAVTARQGERAAEPLMVGAAPVGRGVWNPLCLSRAPEPPGGFLSLHIPESEWGDLNGDYVRDFGPAEETMSWDFAASGAESPGDLTLEITGIDLPPGTRLRLSDLEAGWTREVLAGQSITVAATAGPRHFRLVAGGSALQGTGMPLADGFRRVYPNPFVDRAGMAFGLAIGGDLKAEIFDVAGRRVADLSRVGLGPGEHVLVWDGRDRGGSRAAPGVYLARWQAGRTSGTQRLVKVE